MHGRADRLRVSTTGTIGTGRIGLTAVGPTPPLTVTFDAERLNPSQLYRQAPPGALDLTASAVIESMTDLTVQSRIEGRGAIRTAVGTVTIRAATLAAKLAQQRAHIRWGLDSTIGRANGFVRLSSVLTNPHIDSTRLVVHQLQLGRLDAVPIVGTVSATITARDPLEPRSFAPHSTVGRCTTERCASAICRSGALRCSCRPICGCAGTESTGVRLEAPGRPPPVRSACTGAG